MSQAPPSEASGLLETDAVPAIATFTIDAAARSIVAADAAGSAMWGDAPVALDRAMPALQRLLRIAAAGEPGPHEETLVLWTARGTVTALCRIEVPAKRPRQLRVSLLREIGGRAGASAERHAPPVAAAAAEACHAGDAALRARLAHELRTPLSAVIAYAEILKDEHFGPLGNARYRTYAADIYDSARHALGVADGMLRSEDGPSGLPQLTFADIDPAVTVERCLAVARPLAARAGLALGAEVPAGLPRIVADELSLRQMLLNLLTNAIKFARRGDRVTVSVRYDRDGPLCISVADTGPGMGGTPHQRDGRPPATAAPRAANAGLGLGLPLTRSLAKANGAVLAIESAAGRGTCATISFGKDRVVPV